MVRLRKQTTASGQRRLHRRRWRQPGESAPTHEEIIEGAAEEAQEIGKSLTAIRKHVLHLLLNAERPLTAYEVLESLKGVGSISPPTAYRALDFLIHLGYVQRVETLNAYIALGRGPSDVPVTLFVCENCGQATEIEAPGAVEALMDAVKQEGVVAKQVALEVRGTCKGTLGCTPHRVPSKPIHRPRAK